MDLGNGSAIADRFAAYAGELTKVIGHVDRSRPLRVIAAGYRARSSPDELLQQQNWVSVILFACWRPHSANQTCAARLEHGPIAANGTGRDSGQGKLLRTVLAGVAEVERDIIRDRTGDGRKRAMANGVRFGRNRSSHHSSGPRPSSAGAPVRLWRRLPKATRSM